MDVTWKDNEAFYCCALVATMGDDNVGHDPKTIAAYLRLQASDAFRDGHYELSARLGAAATCINHDARNNHAPNWASARIILRPIVVAAQALIDAA